jgi:hypothetical protein
MNINKIDVWNVQPCFRIGPCVLSQRKIHLVDQNQRSQPVETSE